MDNRDRVQEARANKLCKNPLSIANSKHAVYATAKKQAEEKSAAQACATTQTSLSLLDDRHCSDVCVAQGRKMWTGECGSSQTGAAQTTWIVREVPSDLKMLNGGQASRKRLIPSPHLPLSLQPVVKLQRCDADEDVKRENLNGTSQIEGTGVEGKGEEKTEKPLSPTETTSLQRCGRRPRKRPHKFLDSDFVGAFVATETQPGGKNGAVANSLGISESQLAKTQSKGAGATATSQSDSVSGVWPAESQAEDAASTTAHQASPEGTAVMEDVCEKRRRGRPRKKPCEAASMNSKEIDENVTTEMGSVKAEALSNAAESSRFADSAENLPSGSVGGAPAESQTEEAESKPKVRMRIMPTADDPEDFDYNPNDDDNDGDGDSDGDWEQDASSSKTGSVCAFFFNPFTAEVAIMRLLGSAPKSHLCDQKRRSKVTGLSDLMTLFIDIRCLYCKHT
jgi:hypothetical protein